MNIAHQVQQQLDLVLVCPLVLCSFLLSEMEAPSALLIEVGIEIFYSASRFIAILAICKKASSTEVPSVALLS